MPKKRKTKQAEAQKQERREQILIAARDIFAKRGYHQTTIDDIVAQAGVARGTFYLYFEDRRAVFSELIDAYALKLSSSIVRIVTENPAVSVAEQVRENIRSIIRTSLAERSMTKILFTCAIGIDPDFDRKLSFFYDGMVQLLVESLKDGQALGIVRDGEPRVLAYLSIGALKEFLYQAVTLGLSEESAEVLMQQIFTFLSEGYLRVSAQSPEPSPAKRKPRAPAKNAATAPPASRK